MSYLKQIYPNNFRGEKNKNQNFRSSSLGIFKRNIVIATNSQKHLLFPQDFFKSTKGNNCIKPGVENESSFGGNKVESKYYSSPPEKKTVPHQSKVIIDLQKEFDEDRELLELLNSTVPKKVCEMIPEVDEDKKAKLPIKIIDDLSKSKGQKPQKNSKIIILSPPKTANSNATNSDTPSTTEVTHDSTLRAKSHYSKINSQIPASVGRESDLFLQKIPITTRHKTPSDHVVLPKLNCGSTCARNCSVEDKNWFSFKTNSRNGFDKKGRVKINTMKEKNLYKK